MRCPFRVSRKHLTKIRIVERCSVTQRWRGFNSPSWHSSLTFVASARVVGPCKMALPDGAKWILRVRQCRANLILRRGNTMRSGIRIGCFLLLLFLIAFSPTDASSASKHHKDDPSQSKKAVFVCACLGNRSCSCMTEAKMEGPCACGTQGGPPMKAVAPDSDWAKQNRDELAK